MSRRRLNSHDRCRRKHQILILFFYDSYFVFSHFRSHGLTEVNTYIHMKLISQTQVSGVLVSQRAD